MTHRRIRPFNTSDTYPEQRLDNDLAQAVVAGDTIYVRGQVGQDLDTSESVGIGDPAEEDESHQELDTARNDLRDFLWSLQVHLIAHYFSHQARIPQAVQPELGFES